MTKRPRLSQNLRPSGKMRLDAASELQNTETVSPDPDIRTSQLNPVAPPPQTPAPEKLLPRSDGTDSLPLIFGDAILALSLASMFGWTQGLMLQMRLVSHVAQRSIDALKAG